MKRNRLTLFALALIAPVLWVVGLATAVFPPTAHAAPLETVTNLNDSGAGSLRQAIANVDPGGTIDFAVSGTILLLNELVINKDLTIQGNMPITVSGNNAVRVFSVNAGTSVTLDSLTIAHGSAGNGGGINNNGSLRVNNSTLSENSAVNGGGIYNLGDLILDATDLISNTTTSEGAGLYNMGGTVNLTNGSQVETNVANGWGGGGIANVDGQLTINASTIASNRANNVGGGVYNPAPGGVITLTNGSQVILNRANTGAGIATSQGSRVTINASTVASNTASLVAVDLCH